MKPAPPRVLSVEMGSDFSKRILIDLKALGDAQRWSIYRSDKLLRGQGLSLLPSPQKAGRKVFPSFVCDLVGLIDAAFDQDVNGVSRLVFQPGREY